MSNLKSIRVHIHIPPEWRHIIDAAAKAAGMSRSQYVVRAAVRAASRGKKNAIPSH